MSGLRITRIAPTAVIVGAEQTEIDGHPSPTVEVAGGVRSRSVGPVGASLWLARVQLDDGASIRWNSSHGDEALYVVSGALEVDGLTCPADGAVIVEAAVTTTVTASGPTEVVHVGPADPTPPTDGVHGPAATEGRGVRVIGTGGVWSRAEDIRRTRFFADATSPTCRLWLLYTERLAAAETPGHSHSEDELIHVLKGTIRLGRREAGPGDSVWIAGDRRYQLRSDGPFAFLNYRRDASFMTIGRDDERAMPVRLDPVEAPAAAD